ncbi:hypothetical protein [Nitratireductor basaltis]|uniref:Glycosyltransferase RgtA/B/C/D-like domain-containing protein n=1 Tax=Nitratireductor basaltis TaxID=472175 RepID=A0A084U9Z3_9HYPH|nr:hypothetical protein [Nitratireductor basaltis]KFB09779.1 hypothetical protein EL18_00798 [Nitratireductor basaltis]
MSMNEYTMIGRVLTARAAASLTSTLLARPLLDKAAALFMTLCILAVAAYGLLKPDYNWDMVAYVATALEDRIEEPQALHRETWSLIEQGVSENQEYHLKFSNPYNLNQWENPQDFQSQLSMYRVKVAYVALMRLLEPVTGLVWSSIILSVVPSLLLGALCLYWLWRADALQGAVFLVPLFLLTDYSRMTSAVVPDMLLAFISMVALYALWRGRDALGCLLLFASVFVRPDNLILIFALLIASVLFNWRWIYFLATFAAAFVACMLISKLGNHPGWWAHFYFSCIEIQNSMAGFAPDFSPLMMVKGYVRGLVVALQHNDWPALLLVLCAGWALLSKYGLISGKRVHGLAFALAIGALGKFASFPLPDDRFYFVFIAGLAMVLVASWKPSFEVARSA